MNWITRWFLSFSQGKMLLNALPVLSLCTQITALKDAFPFVISVVLIFMNLSQLASTDRLFLSVVIYVADG